MHADQLSDAATRLHRFIEQEHWNGSALVGPDPGIRFNARVGRFLKSYLSVVPWSDDMMYMQAQAYWIFDNWLLDGTMLSYDHAEIAIKCSQSILDAQHNDGHWDYPNPEWKTRVATVEGCFAALALLETYGRTGDEACVDGALRWHDYTERHVRFRRNPGGVAINYFAATTGDGGGVPNNSTLYLWFLGSLARCTGDADYLSRAESLISWLTDVQLPSGELPYAVSGTPGADRRHFLCYQYNAFEFMDLVHYRRLTGDDSVVPVLRPLARYLSEGINPRGSGRYSCVNDTPIVTYYTAAIGQALSQATELGYGDYRPLVECAYAWLLSNQRPDGNLAYYSTRNHGFLTDRRSYPRYLSMILNHLLLEQHRLERTPQDTEADEVT